MKVVVWLVLFSAFLVCCEQQSIEKPGSGIDFEVFGNALLRDFRENAWTTLRGKYASGEGKGPWSYQSGVKNGEFLCVFYQANLDTEELTKLVFHRNAPVDPLYPETDALVERLKREIPNLAKLAKVIDVYDLVEFHQSKERGPEFSSGPSTRGF